MFFFLMMSSISVSALSVDSMVKLSDDNGNGYFVINNSSDNKMYITAEVKKIISTNKDNVSYEPYTKDNISDWQLSLSTTKFILSPNESKNIGLRSLCNGSCSSERDQYYSVSFMPSFYNDLNKENGAEIGFLYGYEPLYIIPTKRAHMQYEIYYNSKSITINNTGNTLLKANINECKITTNKQCNGDYMVISGREKSFDLPNEIGEKNKLRIDILNHDGSYFKTVEIDKNKLFKSKIEVE